MNIFTRHWPKLKQEMLTILYLSCIQILWFFNLPAFTKLEAPSNTIVPVVMSALTIVFLSVVIAKTHAYVQSRGSNVSYFVFSKYPYGQILNIVHVVCCAAGLYIGMRVSNNYFYHMTNSWFIFFYINTLIATVLVYRAIHRKPLSER